MVGSVVFRHDDLASMDGTVGNEAQFARTRDSPRDWTWRADNLRDEDKVSGQVRIGEI